MGEIKDFLRRGRRVLKALKGQDVLFRPQIRCKKAYFGNEGCRWCICPDGLTQQSIVYSFGIGEDISFDLALIERFGVSIHAFDPTPKSIDWVNSQTLPEEFILHKYGLAAQDGTIQVFPPENPNHVSHSFVQRSEQDNAVEVPVHRLATVMQMLGHSEIDILKIDIEGAEYDVIDDIVESGIPINQLLIEFHHRWPEIGAAKTRQGVERLLQAGYRIFDVSPTGEEYSFIKQG